MCFSLSGSGFATCLSTELWSTFQLTTYLTKLLWHSYSILILQSESDYKWCGSNVIWTANLSAFRLVFITDSAREICSLGRLQRAAGIPPLPTARESATQVPVLVLVLCLHLVVKLARTDCCGVVSQCGPASWRDPA